MQKRNTAAIILILLIIFLPLRGQGLEKIIAKGAKLEKAVDGFQFTEGPSADKQGSVFFTDQPNDRIIKWDIKTGLSVFMQPCGRSNGMAFDNEGNLWACADEKNEIWKISPDKSITKFPGVFEGKFFNGPNDLWAAPGGGIFFTDPFYKRPWWDHENMPQPVQGVYYMFPDHSRVIRVADDLAQPNGIAGTTDGKYLFVADIGADKTWKYACGPEGSLSDKKLFCSMGSDGMTIDAEGNIYLTGNGVTVFDKTGKKLGNIPVPEGWTANVCFGGKDLHTLFITASKSLYMIKLRVRGTRS